jgi:flagellar basal-body rod protein FlgC
VAPIDGPLGLFRGLAISASGLSAQRRRMDVIATNIANAETTRTPEGGPFRRRILELREAQGEAMLRRTDLGPELSLRVPEVPDVSLPAGLSADAQRVFGVEIVGVREDLSEGPLVYEPGHPDADESGYVRYPNVNLTEETLSLMETRRLYEANATVFDAIKSMLRRATQI